MELDATRVFAFCNELKRYYQFNDIAKINSIRHPKNTFWRTIQPKGCCSVGPNLFPTEGVEWHANLQDATIPVRYMLSWLCARSIGNSCRRCCKNRCEIAANNYESQTFPKSKKPAPCWNVVWCLLRAIIIQQTGVCELFTLSGRNFMTTTDKRKYETDLPEDIDIVSALQYRCWFYLGNP